MVTYQMTGVQILEQIVYTVGGGKFEYSKKISPLCTTSQRFITAAVQFDMASDNVPVSSSSSLF